MDAGRHHKKRTQEKRRTRCKHNHLQVVFCCFLANKTQCPYCKWIKPIPKGREIEQTEGELTEFDKEQYKLKLKLETRAARDYDSLVALGRQRGYKWPEQWADRQLEIREAYRAKSRN